MKSHLLAKRLLEMPDVDVVIGAPKAGEYTNIIFLQELPKENIHLNCQCADCVIQTETVISIEMD